MVNVGSMTEESSIDLSVALFMASNLFLLRKRTQKKYISYCFDHQ